jgi:phage portal protein BeeE
VLEEMMQLFGRAISLRSPIRLTRMPTTFEPIRRGVGGGSWLSIREPYTGAWQNNDELTVDSPIANPTAFSCITLIATDVGKLELRLVQDENGDGVWIPTTNPAYSPLLRRPNRYQLPTKFVEHWMLSKLTNGNTYALKERDGRGIVIALYILDPSKVWPVVASDGGVYYELTSGMWATGGVGIFPGLELPHELAGPRGGFLVPAREIIHDLMYPLFHPLIGVSPVFAAAAPAIQGLTIQSTSTKFFGQGSKPSGVLSAPGNISQDTSDRIKNYWQTEFTGNNAGKVAVLGQGLKYEQLSVSAVDADLIKQLQWTTAEICKCYHVPVSLIDTSQQPPYGKQEYLFRQYYSQCLQTLLVNFEAALDDGLELAPNLGVELDIDGLIWMDTETRTKAAADSIGAGALAPNEARYKYFGVGPVKGGDSPYLQQQYYSLEALAARDDEDPFAKPAPPPPADGELLAAMVSTFQTKAFPHDS